MATTDGSEWKRCDEHGIRYDDHLCPLCQGQDDDGRQGQDHGGGFAGVPAELTDRDRWLLYDTDHPRFRPRQALGWDSDRGQLTPKWKDAEYKLSFDDARELAAEKESRGIGYALDESGPFTVIDIDRGIDDRGRPKEWCPKLDPFVDETYFDLSPSGSGIHLWLRGDLPEWADDLDDDALAADGEHEQIDLFGGEGRFMTVTDDAPPRLEGKRRDTIAPIDDAAAEFLQDAWINLNGDEPAPWKGEPGGRTPGESRSNPAPAGEFDENGEWLGEAEAREALQCIDPNVGYDTWRNIGFALTDEFGESAGGRLFREWSKQGGKWDSEAPRYADEIIGRDDSGVTIGTLVYHAKAGGWDPSGAAREALGDDLQADHAPRVVDSGGGSSGGSLSWGDVEAAFFDDDKTRKAARKAAQNKAAEKLLSDHTYVTPRDTRTIWVYHPGEGIYDRAGESHIQETIEKHLGPIVDNNFTNQIVEKVSRRSRIDREAFDDRGGRFLCLENGVFDLETMELQDHSAEYMFRKRLPVEYDPEAPPGPIWDLFRDVTGREAGAKTLSELVAHSIRADHEPRAAFGMLIGDGANGKGVVEYVITQFLGPENVAGVDLHDLSGNRFAPARLENKFANIGADIPGAKVNDLSTLKSMTGGDRLHVERKYESGYDTRIPATPIFSVNQPPTFGEKDHALARRIVPVEFPYTFTFDDDDEHRDAEPEHQLKDRLTTPEALSGFLNVVLDSYQRLRANGDFSLPEGPGERLEKYERQADPISAFARECLENRAEGYVTKSAAYEAYVAYCDKNDKEPKTKATFYRELPRTGGFNVETSKVRLGEFGDRGRVRVLKRAFFTAKGRDLCPPSNWKETQAVNRKRGVVDLPGDGPAPGIDHENAENRGFGQKEIVNDIQAAAAFGDGGVPKDELAEFVAKGGGYDPDTVKAWIDRLEGQRLTKTPGGYDAKEKADLSDLAD